VNSFLTDADNFLMSHFSIWKIGTRASPDIRIYCTSFVCSFI